MTNLLALTRAATEQRGTTNVVQGIEVACTLKGPTVSIAVACTDSLQDLTRSLKIASGNVNGYRCHGGYLEAARLVHAEMKPIVRRGSVRLAGHSMGGAIVRQLAYLFMIDMVHVEWVETYGEPASLPSDFPMIFPGARYVCGSDPIPLWCPGYCHNVSPVKLGSNYCWFPGRGILDHRLESYEMSL